VELVVRLDEALEVAVPGRLHDRVGQLTQRPDRIGRHRARDVAHRRDLHEAAYLHGLPEVLHRRGDDFEASVRQGHDQSLLNQVEHCLTHRRRRHSELL